MESISSNISVNQQSIDLRKLLRDSNGRIEVLKDKSKVSKRRKRRETDIRIIDFIVDVRKRYPKMGKEKIKVLLDEYCRDKGIKTISSSTIEG
ncbi:MAG: hypothetical protein ACP5KX_07940 [Caldisericia bacterium]